MGSYQRKCRVSGSGRNRQSHDQNIVECFGGNLDPSERSLYLRGFEYRLSRQMQKWSEICPAIKKYDKWKNIFNLKCWGRISRKTAWAFSPSLGVVLPWIPPSAMKLPTEYSWSGTFLLRASVALLIISPFNNDNLFVFYTRNCFESTYGK